MAPKKPLLDLEDAELLIEGVALTLNAITAYLDGDGLLDPINSMRGPLCCYRFAGSCVKVIADFKLRGDGDQARNVLQDIVQKCHETNQNYAQPLLLYLGNISVEFTIDDEFEPRSPVYEEAALLYAKHAIDLLLSITKRHKSEIERMVGESWTAYKSLVLVRLTLIEQWQKTLQGLNRSCQRLVQSEESDDGMEIIQRLRKMFRQVDLEDLLNKKPEHMSV